MEVLIASCGEKATDLNGNVYEILGIEITQKETGQKIFYDKKTSFYHAVAQPDTKSNAYRLPSGKLMLT